MMLDNQVRYNTPLSAWLNELRETTDVECLSALQAKSVATDPESFEALSIRNAQIAIAEVRAKSVAIIDKIDALIDCLPITTKELLSLRKEFDDVGGGVAEAVGVCRRRGCDYLPSKVKCSTAVGAITANMTKFIADFLAKHKINNAQLEATLRKLKERFGELVDITIRRDCEVIRAFLTLD